MDKHIIQLTALEEKVSSLSKQLQNQERQIAEELKQWKTDFERRLKESEDKFVASL